MKNILMWFSERFPAVSVFSAYLIAAASLSWARYSTGQTVEFYPADLWVGIVATLQFLLLRILDEHKDYEADLVAHPERVLQKGLVTLKQLKIIGLGSCLLSLGLTLLLSTQWGVFLWALMMFWTFLMTKEFFIEKFLRPKLFLYSFTHLMVLPFMALWMFSFAVEAPIATLPKAFVFFAFILANGLIYDVVRKMRGQDEVSDNEIMFTQIWGRKKVCFVVLGLVSLSAVFFLILVSNTNHWVLTSVMAFGVFLSVASTYQFFKDPMKKKRKGVEGATALYSLIVYLGLTLSFVLLGV